MDLADNLHHFLFKHGLIKAKLLLAISGGSDSMALLHAFRGKHHFPTLQLGVAHIDHCWRKESSEQALALEKIVNDHSMQWHLKTLNPSELSGNLEEACRKERLSFFEGLCRKHGYEGVLLAHHADDQAETVLKRLFESSSLLSAKGMQEKTKHNDLTLYRPFLSITKDTILKYLQKHEITFIDDPTNLDEKYTRARFRATIIPQLTASFGKEISSSLTKLGETLHEMDDFILSQMPSVIKGWNGWMVDCSNLLGMHSFLIRHILIGIFREQKLTVPSSMTGHIMTDIKEGNADKTYILGINSLTVDRGHLFVYKQIAEAPPRMKLSPGENIWGSWKIILSENKENLGSYSGWKNLWEKKVHFKVPDNEYFVGVGCNEALYTARNKKLGRWWTESKVPAFLRAQVPVIWHKDNTTVAAEFLGPPPQNEKLPLSLSIDFLYDKP